MTFLQALAGEEKTPEIVDQIIAQCFPLINSQLNKFYLYNDPDALSFAYEALYKAIITYEDDGRSKFLTYATVCIYNSLGSYVRALKSKQQDISLQTVIAETGEELMDVVPLDYDMSACVVGEMTATIYKDIVDKMIQVVTNDKQRSVLQYWASSDFEARQSDIAAHTGISQSYVNQTLATFRNKLKKKLEEIGHGTTKN